MPTTSSPWGMSRKDQLESECRASEMKSIGAYNYKIEKAKNGVGTASVHDLQLPDDGNNGLCAYWMDGLRKSVYALLKFVLSPLLAIVGMILLIVGFGNLFVSIDMIRVNPEGACGDSDGTPDYLYNGWHLLVIGFSFLVASDAIVVIITLPFFLLSSLDDENKKNNALFENWTGVAKTCFKPLVYMDAESTVLDTILRLSSILFNCFALGGSVVFYHHVVQTYYGWDEDGNIQTYDDDELSASEKCHRLRLWYGHDRFMAPQGNPDTMSADHTIFETIEWLPTLLIVVCILYFGVSWAMQAKPLCLFPLCFDCGTRNGLMKGNAELGDATAERASLQVEAKAAAGRAAARTKALVTGGARTAGTEKAAENQTVTIFGFLQKLPCPCFGDVAGVFGSIWNHTHVYNVMIVIFFSMMVQSVAEEGGANHDQAYGYAVQYENVKDVTLDQFLVGATTWPTTSTGTYTAIQKTGSCVPTGSLPFACTSSQDIYVSQCQSDPSSTTLSGLVSNDGDNGGTNMHAFLQDALLSYVNTDESDLSMWDPICWVDLDQKHYTALKQTLLTASADTQLPSPLIATISTSSSLTVLESTAAKNAHGGALCSTTLPTPAASTTYAHFRNINDLLTWTIKAQGEVSLEYNRPVVCGADVIEEKIKSCALKDEDEQGRCFMHEEGSNVEYSDNEDGVNQKYWWYGTSLHKIFLPADTTLSELIAFAALFGVFGASVGVLARTSVLVSGLCFGVFPQVDKLVPEVFTSNSKYVENVKSLLPF